MKTDYTLKSIALGVISFFLFPGLPGTFAWSADGAGKEKKEKWAQNEVLYKLKSTAGFEQTPLIRSELDADIDEEIAEVEFDSIRRLRSRSKSTEDLIQRLMRNPHVLYAEPNYIVTINKTPNDPSYGNLWGLSKISAPLAWDVTTGTGDVVVGVVDTGVDYAHTDLAANIWSNPGGINGCPQGTRGFNAITKTCDPMDDHNHGTHVSGTIGAVGNNGTGVAGVNWTTKIMGLKFISSSGSGYTSDAIAAIDWAIAAKQAGVNVRVLNNSYGGGGFSQSLLDVINKAASRDILFVAAAGNDTNNNDVTPFYPASYGTPNEIAVAATTSSDVLAWFSNYGANSVDLGAPGENILSTTPNNTYSFYSGTSMAAPHVSGAAALVLSACSQANVNGLKTLILGNVDPLTSLSGIVKTGGRLNVNKAIQNCPSLPRPASLTATAASSSQINLTWTDQSNNETGFQIERKTGAGGTYAQIGTAAANATTYTDSGLLDGTTYFYRVRAVNGSGNSAYSNEASATTQGSFDIIDNGGPGTSYTGSWAASGATGSYGSTSVWARDGAKYTWRFTPTLSGSYQVSMWWTAYSSRSTAVPVDIRHSGGTARVTVNQQLNGAKWNVLGTYSLVGGVTYTVTVTSQPGPSSTCADAVKFAYLGGGGNQPPVANNDTATTPTNTPVTIDVIANDTDDVGINAASVAIVTPPANGTAVPNGNGTVTYTPTAGFTGVNTFTYTVADGQGAVSNPATVTVTVGAVPVDFIIDNGGPGTSYTGTWAASGATGSYGSVSVWSRDGAKYTWSFTPTVSANYQVSMWWTAWSSRSTAVPVDIKHSGGTTRVTINQQANGGKWNGLGTYSLIGGVTYTVTVTSQPGPSSTCADAVKFIGSPTAIKSIAAGGNHNISLKTDGTVSAWEANASGLLGGGTTVNRLTPVVVIKDGSPFK